MVHLASARLFLLRLFSSILFTHWTFYRSFWCASFFFFLLIRYFAVAAQSSMLMILKRAHYNGSDLRNRDTQKDESEYIDRWITYIREKTTTERTIFTKAKFNKLANGIVEKKNKLRCVNRWIIDTFTWLLGNERVWLIYRHTHTHSSQSQVVSGFACHIWNDTFQRPMLADSSAKDGPKRNLNNSALCDRYEVKMMTKKRQTVFLSIFFSSSSSCCCCAC